MSGSADSPSECRVFSPSHQERTVVDGDGVIIKVPAGWELLPPGDAGLTRRVKAAGPSWLVQEKRGRKIFSKGLWAPAENIRSAQAGLEAERSTQAYAKKRDAAVVRRNNQQSAYVGEFETAVYEFLDFHPVYAQQARQLARAVTLHATPVGSGTVARTQRIPLAQRVEAAVIAWLRHQTTAYDQMRIERVKGRRREVRRELAERSRQLMAKYRQGKPVTDCPLQAALGRTDTAHDDR